MTIESFRAFEVSSAGVAAPIAYRVREWPAILVMARLQSRENLLAHLADLQREFDLSIEAEDYETAARLHYSDIPVARGMAEALA